MLRVFRWISWMVAGPILFCGAVVASVVVLMMIGWTSAYRTVRDVVYRCKTRGER